jgi:hypothetical protein
MTMLEFFVTISAVTAFIGITGIVFWLIFRRKGQYKRWVLFFGLVLLLFSSLGVAINGFLAIDFDIAFENWEALDNPSVLLTFHFMLFVFAFVLNCISTCLQLVQINKKS